MVSSGVGIFNIRKKETRMSQMRSTKKITGTLTSKYAGTNFDGQEESLQGFVFQLASEKKRDAHPDQFKETREKIATYCTTNLKRTPEIVQSILRDMAELHKPTKLPEPPGYDSMSPFKKNEVDLQQKSRMEKVEAYEQEKLKIIGIVLQQCSKKMKTRLEELPDYTDIRKNRDLLKLLQEIEQLSYDDVKQLYPTASLVDAIGHLFLPQKRNEKIDDYYRVFEQRVNAVKYIDPHFFRNKKLAMDELKIDEADYHKLYGADKSKFDDAGTQVENRVLGAIFLRNANNKTYSSYKNKIYNDLVDGQNNFPTSPLNCLRNLQLHRPTYTSSPNNETEQNSFNQTNDANEDNIEEGHCELFYTKTFNKKQKDWIVLDTGASGSLFCNEDFVKNIRKTNETCKIHSSGGILSTNKKATVPGYGDVWYHPKALSNVISVDEATDRDMFIALGKNKTMRFGPDHKNTAEFSSSKYKVQY